MSVREIYLKLEKVDFIHIYHLKFLHIWIKSAPYEKQLAFGKQSVNRVYRISVFKAVSKVS